MARHSDEVVIAAWKKFGSPGLVAKELGQDVRKIHERRRSIETRHGITLPTWNDTSDRRVVLKHDEGRIDFQVENGCVIVFSDAHYWPNIKTTSHRALIAMIRQLRPVAVVANGDLFDGATISRYPRIGWDTKPTVLEEVGAVDAALAEIEAVCAEVGCPLKIWNLGNHDARFETKLAANAPQFEGVHGFKLKDHFPNWRPAWTTWINDEVCITHFYHCGIHATHNNLLKGQCHYVTGHTHSAKVTPWTGARGTTLYAMDTGSLADALGPHNLDYQQGRHGNHRSAFGVLTFKDGALLEPELVQKWDEDHVQFRGHILHADTGAVV